LKSSEKESKEKLLRLRLRPMYSDEELEVYRIKIASEQYVNYAVERIGEWLEEAVASYHTRNKKKRPRRRRR
jgi:hypothetical protein